MPNIGDVLFENLDTLGTGHTAMYVLSGKIVHSIPIDIETANGVILDYEECLSEKIHYFSCSNVLVAKEAARLATKWSNHKIRTPFSGEKMVSANGYKEGRTLGITEAKKLEYGGKYLQFGLDALYRVFKWAVNNAEKPFSENRGVTCAPFVTACYQTAWLRYRLNFQQDVIVAYFNMLKEIHDSGKISKDNRINKLHCVTPSKTPLGRRPFPQYSRIDGDISTDLWNKIFVSVRECTGETINEPQDLLTQALLVDAKFNSTKNFYESLQHDEKKWTKGMWLRAA